MTGLLLIVFLILCFKANVLRFWVQ